LLGEHKGIEAVGRKGRGSDDESRGAQLPKSKVLIRKEVNLEECHSAAEVDLPIVKKGMKMQSNGELGHGLGSAIVPQRRDFHGVINPLLSWRKTLVIKGAEEVENAEANSKYQEKVEGQKLWNFIRSVSTRFSSR
ncbi:hypothetical protein BHE74_00046530, partial [Ensete ventricosum]